MSNCSASGIPAYRAFSCNPEQARSQSPTTAFLCERCSTNGDAMPPACFRWGILSLKLSENRPQTCRRQRGEGVQLCTNCQRPMLSKRLSWARKPYLGLVYVPSRPRHFARSCPRPVCMRYNCALGAAPPRATRVTLGASESPFFSTYGNFNTARATGEVHACRKH